MAYNPRTTMPANNINVVMGLFTALLYMLMADGYGC